MNNKEILIELLDYDKNFMKYKAPICEEFGDISYLRENVNIFKANIAIYGAGKIGVGMLMWLREHGMEPDFFIDEKLQGCTFSDVKIISKEEAKSFFKKDLYFVVIAFKGDEREYKELTKELISYGVSRIFQYNDSLPLFCQFRELALNKDRIVKCYDCFDEDFSKQCYVEYFRAKITRDYFRLKEYNFTDKYFCEELFDVKKIGHFVCLGGFTGDTVMRFIERNKDFRKVTVYEGDSAGINEMTRNFSYFSDDIKNKICIVPKYAGNGGGSVLVDDTLDVKEGKILISMDIEGAELSVLQGTEKIIKSIKPILALSAYHKIDDFPVFVEYLSALNPDYKFYIRKYKSSIFAPSTNEIVLYAV